MSLRTGHGNGAGKPRVEVLPADELPAGLPENGGQESRMAANETGRFTEGNRRSVLGGRARAGKTRLADRLGLRQLPAGSAFESYKAAAVSFRRAQCSALASSAGGGVCGPGPSSFVASAALQLAWSRYLSDLAAEKGDAELALQASRLANDSRQNLLAAHELCAREAEARRAGGGRSPRDLSEHARRLLTQREAANCPAPARDQGAVARPSHGTTDKADPEQRRASEAITGSAEEAAK